MNTLSKRIISFRESNSMSQSDLANRIGLERTALNKIEKGKRKVTVQELIKFARTFNVSIDTLLGIRDTNFNNKSLPIQLDTADNLYLDDKPLTSDEQSSIVTYLRGYRAAKNNQ